MGYCRKCDECLDQPCSVAPECAWDIYKARVWLVDIDFKHITKFQVNGSEAKEISRVQDTYEHTNNYYLAITHCKVVRDTLKALEYEVEYGPPEGHPDLGNKRLWRQEDAWP